MAYKKLDLKNGATFDETHIAHIENGIAENEKNIGNKQDQLESGANIKTINGQSVLGSGNIAIEGGNTDLYNEAKKLISRFQHQYFKSAKDDTDAVDIAIFAGQSNSCGRATPEDIKTANDLLIPCPIERGFSFNNKASTTPVQIVEPISANGSSAYGYIPAFINSYNEVTGRKVCAVYQSTGGVMLNKFAPYVLDDTTGEETKTAGTYYSNIVNYVNHAKTNLESNGYTVGDVFLVWCQGEADAAYLGNVNNYANAYEESLSNEEEIREYYKARFARIIEKLKEDVGLTTAFIIRIGHQRGSYRNGNIIDAQTEMCRENPDCVMVSSIFAGAQKFVEEDGTVRDLMRDASHYVPEGYIRAGLEAGVNAGIYNNSGKLVKPILLEYHVLYRNEDAEHERPVDAYIYDPCRVDMNFIRSFASVEPTAISLHADETEVAVNSTLQIKCSYTPANASGKVLYTASNSNATISESGLVTGVATGDVVIMATLESNNSITASLSLTVVEASESGGNTEEPTGTAVFDFDFTTNTIDDYALSGVFTVPEGSNTSAIEYDATHGMSLNNQLPNGLNFVTPLDASKAWALEFTALFATPTVLAGNRRAFLGGADLYPFVFINGTTFDKMGFQISNGNHATIGYGNLVYDKECDYKIVHDGNGKVTAYADGVEIGSGSVNFAGQSFTVMLGNVKGKSSAYVWQNVETNKSYLRKMKFSYSES